MLLNKQSPTNSPLPRARPHVGQTSRRRAAACCGRSATCHVQRPQRLPRQVHGTGQVQRQAGARRRGCRRQRCCWHILGCGGSSGNEALCCRRMPGHQDVIHLLAVPAPARMWGCGSTGASGAQPHDTGSCCAGGWPAPHHRPPHRRRVFSALIVKRRPPKLGSPGTVGGVKGGAMSVMSHLGGGTGRGECAQCPQRPKIHQCVALAHSTPPRHRTSCAGPAACRCGGGWGRRRVSACSVSARPRCLHVQASVRRAGGRGCGWPRLAQVRQVPVQALLLPRTHSQAQLVRSSMRMILWPGGAFMMALRTAEGVVAGGGAWEAVAVGMRSQRPCLQSQLSRHSVC